MSINNKILEKIKNDISDKNTKLLIVTKTRSQEDINQLIKMGYSDFAENRVQEAQEKFIDILPNKDIKLNLIGPLQSNKAKKGVDLFDYIHSLDNQKLAETLSKIEKRQNKKVKYFIQVNIGKEKQKSGIPYNEVDAFFNYCTKEKKMNVLGLMAIPPNDKNTEKHFKSLSELNASLGLKELSMGMSSDYMLAARFHATFLRIGSSIFGDRV